MITKSNSFINTIGSIISGYIGYVIPFILSSHASWLNLTLGGLLLWVYNHFYAPKVTTQGIKGIIG